MAQIQLYPSQTKNKYRFFFQAKGFEDSIPSNVYSKKYFFHCIKKIQLSPTYIISILNKEVKIFSRKAEKCTLFKTLSLTAYGISTVLFL